MVYLFQGPVRKAKEIKPNKRTKINLEDDCLSDSSNTPAANKPMPATTPTSSALENEAITFNKGLDELER